MPRKGKERKNWQRQCAQERKRRKKNGRCNVPSKGKEKKN